MSSAVLERLEASLRGPRRARQDMLAEIRDGLQDATDAYRAAGLPARTARERAEAEFGDAEQIAAELQAELTARYGLRSALMMAIVLGALTTLWDVIWQFAPTPNPVEPKPVVVLLSSVIDTVSLAAAACGALALVLLATGNRVPTSWAVRLLGWSALIAFGVITVASGGMHLTGVPAHPAYVLPVIAAGCVSLVLGSWVVVRAVRCLQLTKPQH
ncbi:permease prefix domain 1-containing protein [Thermocrispum municipale]|uniref:permease prefix domain 1-containing protein n=1 Tax=Thermocrispum municipale TaxID=37926 RepID=UPI0003FD416D|nr:permease prefix domain 1-containing protein [Thermocrispum municipale]